MRPDKIVRGQRVDEDKARFARQLRREMTPAEQMLWDLLRRNQLDGLHFRRQQVITGFIAYFYCHTAGVVVELDGGVHDRQREADAERDQVFAGLGLTVLRFRNDEVFESRPAILSRISSVCASRTAEEKAIGTWLPARNTTPPPPGPLPRRERGRKATTLFLPLSLRGRGPGGGVFGRT